MQKLNLTEFLKSLGSQILSEIYGKERLQTIIDTIDVNVSEGTIVALLKSRYSTQIFSNKLLRGFVFGYLPDSYVNYLITGTFDETKKVKKEDKENLIRLSWNRNTKSIQRLIKIFDLEEEYLPPKVVQTSSVILIKPKFTLFAHQKTIHFLLDSLSPLLDSLSLFAHQDSIHFLLIKDQFTLLLDSLSFFA